MEKDGDVHPFKCPLTSLPVSGSASRSVSWHLTRPKLNQAGSENPTNSTARRKDLKRPGDTNHTEVATKFARVEVDEVLWKTAAAYIRIVKEASKDHPETFNNFLCHLRDFKQKQIPMNSLINRVKELFKDHPHLIKGFALFLPSNNEKFVNKAIQSRASMSRGEPPQVMLANPVDGHISGSMSQRERPPYGLHCLPQTVGKSEGNALFQAAIGPAQATSSVHVQKISQNNFSPTDLTNDHNLKPCDVQHLQQFRRDVEDEEDWIREKKHIITSTINHQGMSSIQNLMEMHKALQAELARHDSRIARVHEFGAKMVSEGDFASDDIQRFTTTLSEHWNNLKVQTQQRCTEIEHSLLAAKYYASANKEHEKQPIVGEPNYKDKDSTENMTNRGHQKLSDACHAQQFFHDMKAEEDWIMFTNCGLDLKGLQNLIKKHLALEAELAGHESSIMRVYKLGIKMVNKGHFASNYILQRTNLLRAHWNNLKVKVQQMRTVFENSLKMHERVSTPNDVGSSACTTELGVRNTDYGKAEDSTDVFQHFAQHVDEDVTQKFTLALTGERNDVIPDTTTQSNLLAGSDAKAVVENHPEMCHI